MYKSTLLTLSKFQNNPLLSTMNSGKKLVRVVLVTYTEPYVKLQAKREL